MPETGDGSASTDRFCRHPRSGQALLLALGELVVHGVATRTVRAVVEERCGVELSRSAVSARSTRLDAVVQAWTGRGRSVQGYPFLIRDTLVIRVRVEHRVRVRRVLIAAGVNRDSSREVLEPMTGHTQSEATWSALLGGLQGQGLAGVGLAISDGHPGLVQTVHAHFPGPPGSGARRTSARTSWTPVPQRCQASRTAGCG